MAKVDSAPPPVAVTMSITPAAFAIGDNVQIALSITNRASRPFTMFIWPTIFNLRLAQQRRNFRCTDLATDQRVFLELTRGPSREQFSNTMGGDDDVYFHTLEPGMAKTFTDHFSLASRRPREERHKARSPARDTTNDDESDSDGDSEDEIDYDQDAWLTPGCKYRFEVKETEVIEYWAWGRREDVMAPPGVEDDEMAILDENEHPIRLDQVAPVVIEVLPES